MEVDVEAVIEDGRLSSLGALCTAVMCDDLKQNRDVVLAHNQQLPDWVCTILLQHLDSTGSLDDRVLRHFARWRTTKTIDFVQTAAESAAEAAVEAALQPFAVIQTIDDHVPLPGPSSANSDDSDDGDDDNDDHYAVYAAAAAAAAAAESEGIATLTLANAVSFDDDDDDDDDDEEEDKKATPNPLLARTKSSAARALEHEQKRPRLLAPAGAGAAAAAASAFVTMVGTGAAGRHSDAGPAIENERCRIQSFTFTNSAVSSVGITLVVQHPLAELNFTNCESINGTVFEALQAVGGTLKRLCLRNCRNIFAEDFAAGYVEDDEEDEFGDGAGGSLFLPGLSAIPNVSELDVQETSINGDGLNCIPHRVERLWLNNTEVDTADLMRLPSLPLLTELQLSGTRLDYAGYHVFETFPNLTTIGVASCPNMLSSEMGDHGLPADAKLFFRKFGTLSKLEWLDLSMLAVDSDSIQILLSRPNLQFLGLVGNGHISEPWAAVSVAAMHIDQPMSNAQILLAARELLPLRMDVSLYVLRGVFKRLSPKLTVNPKDRLPASDPLIDSVAECIAQFTEELDLQLVASAALFYLTSTLSLHSPEATIDFGRPIRLRVLKVVCDALRRSVDQPDMMLEQLAKNCCLTLRNFHPTKELATLARELAVLLMRAALKYDDQTVRSTAILLCSQHLASLHPSLKEQIGIVGAGVGAGARLDEDVLGMVLELVQQSRVSLLEIAANPEIFPENQRQQEMAVMEGCWTFLWNITDETANNSNRFLDKDGLASLVLTLQNFTDKALRRNTMGLVTNLAEVRELRTRLMVDNAGAPLGLMEEMAKLLKLDDDSQFDLEVTYNIAGTMCHILAEGETFWTDAGLTLEFRRSVLNDIATVVQRWTLTPERWINYRSLRPLIDLLNPTFDTEVHLWAAWAMLSLCFVNGPRYCEMCYREQGLCKVQTLLDLNVPNKKLQAYCTHIVRFCRINLGDSLKPVYGAMTEEEKNSNPPLPVPLHKPSSDIVGADTGAVAGQGGGGGGGDGGGGGGGGGGAAAADDD